MHRCIGCQRKEVHKKCPAHGTAFYCSGVPFTKDIEKLYRECLIAELATDEAFFGIIQQLYNIRDIETLC